jgi:hypothetical protein
MNVYDLTTNQLKRAAAIKEQIDRLSKELRSIFGAPANPRAAKEKPENERFYQKKDCNCSKSKMGELATSESNAVSQTGC